MNFQELGLTLQREREKKGLSIEVVMEATKISRINVLALESGDRSALPHPVYTKGFVKSYARFLGLDSDELSMAVDREFQEEAEEAEEVEEVVPMARQPFPVADSSSEKKRSIWPILLILLVLIGGGISLFIAFTDSTNEQVAPIPQSSESSEEAPAVLTPSDVSESDVDAVSQDSAVNNEDATDANSIATSVPTEKTVFASEVEKDEKVVAKPVEPAKKVDSKKVVVPKAETSKKIKKQQYDHVLIIRAISDKGCWIGVWRGNETAMARDFVLKQGEPLRLMFNNPRRIRIGNASGVSVTYNGKPYSLDAAKGNIQTLKFGMN